MGPIHHAGTQHEYESDQSSRKIKVESIFHPSDFSEASEVAFAHALKIALVTKSKP